MTSTRRTAPPTPVGWHAPLPIIAVALVALSIAGPGRARPPAGLVDPVRVRFAPEGCPSEVFAVEVWDRDGGAWRAHRRHPLLAGDSCAWEDAGQLLNEIRFRCVPRSPDELVSTWGVGIPVFADGVIDVCQPPGPGDARVEIDTPRPGQHIDAAVHRVRVEGRVRLGDEDIKPGDLIRLAVENRTLRRPAEAVRVLGDGRFSAALELAPGPNHLRATATTASRGDVSAAVAVFFDATAAREQALEAERVRRARERRKRVEIEATDPAERPIP